MVLLIRVVDRNHEDLKANMWTNPNEIAGNGKDDDNNGFVDDVHGWDFYDDDNNPDDGGSHGTHCAGTIGAVGNNGKGIVGVCWNVSMVGIRFLGPNGRLHIRCCKINQLCYKDWSGLNLKLMGRGRIFINLLKMPSMKLAGKKELVLLQQLGTVHMIMILPKLSCIL